MLATVRFAKDLTKLDPQNLSFISITLSFISCSPYKIPHSRSFTLTHQSQIVLQTHLESPEMAAACDVFRRSLKEEVEGSIGSPRVSGELHVLAVDDSNVDRKVIERLLKISSCKVTAVESGRRALQYLGLDGEKSTVGFDGLKVNLIMTDYSMPGMTGYELLKKIKESSAFREIPVVIMSAENILTRIDRCLEEGAEEFIVKPVKLSDVKRLKDCIIRGEVEENVKKTTHKRKLQEDNTSSTPSTPLPLSMSLPCELALSLQPSSSPLSPARSTKRPRLHNTD